MPGKIMRRVFTALLSAGMLSGCSLLGYQRIPKAERAPPDEARSIRFPDNFDEGAQLTGPMMAALEVAMNDFLPLGSRVKTNDSDKSIAECLSKRSTFDTQVMKASDNLYFVSFSPSLKRCGIKDYILDGGAVYAIDGKGRILDVH
jgi:hypothetical protein